MNLGNKIRELRRERGLTQEQLASALGISPQAVSKWEMNAGYPDMSLIPIIAGFFKVSLDVLFDFDVNKVDGQIENIISEGKKYFWNNFDRAEEIFLDGVRSYPSSDRIKRELLSLYECYIRNYNKTELTEKAVEIAGRIIAESQDVFCVCSAKADLASIYLMQDNYEEAKKLIDSLPYMYPCMLNDRMRRSAFTLRGEDRLKEASDWKKIEWQELFAACDMEGRGYFELGDYENALISFTQCRDVIERFMIEGKTGYDAYPICGSNSNHAHVVLMIAACKLKLGQVGDIDALAAYAKELYFGAYDTGELDSDPELKNELIGYFTEWYVKDAGLSEFREPELSL